MISQNKMTNWQRVAAAKPVSVIITMSPELRATRLQFDFSRVGTDSQILTSQMKTLSGSGRYNIPSAIAIGKVDPVVQASLESIDAVLLVALGEAFVKVLYDLCLSILVTVRCKKDIRCCTYDHTITPGHDTSGIGNAVKKQGGRVVLAIMVSVFEVSHSSTGLTLVVHPQRIVCHLDHPQFAIGTPVDRNRIHDQWFCSNQFSGESCRQSDGLMGAFG